MPICSPSIRRVRAQTAWNVPIVMSRPRSSPTSRNTRPGTSRVGGVLGYEVGDTVGDDAGLAGAGPGDDQQRPFSLLNGLPLARVEGGEDFRCGGGGHGVIVVEGARGKKEGRDLKAAAFKPQWEYKTEG